MENGYPKYQYSQFDSVGGQYVVRTEDAEEFGKLVKKVHLVVGSAPQAPQTSKSAPTGDKPKVPYMFAGDPCPVCNSGILTKTVKESKTGEKYNALICDQQGCKGFAYISKFPKFGATATPFPKVDDTEISNDDLPF